MLTHMFQHCERGILFELRTTGRGFWFEKVRLQLKIFHTLIREFLYANGIDFLTYIVDDMQHIVDLLAASCTSFDLEISLIKTNVMFTP